MAKKFTAWENFCEQCDGEQAAEMLESMKKKKTTLGLLCLIPGLAIFFGGSYLYCRNTYHQENTGKPMRGLGLLWNWIIILYGLFIPYVSMWCMENITPVKITYKRLGMYKVLKKYGYID